MAILMDQLREDMWAYRQELEFFRIAPEYATLVELRYLLRNQAIRVAELERGGPGAQEAQRELAREMERSARELRRLTGRLEHRTDAGAPREVRRVADSLKTHAERIERHIDRLRDAVT